MTGWKEKKQVLKWEQINWGIIESFLWKLQEGIFTAELANDKQKVHLLQKRLIRSIAARLKAVRIVTQDNRGKRLTDDKDAYKSWERVNLAWNLRLDGKVSKLKSYTFYNRKGLVENIKRGTI